MRCSPRPSSAGLPRERRRDARAPARSAPGRGRRAHRSRAFSSPPDQARPRLRSGLVTRAVHPHAAGRQRLLAGGGRRPSRARPRARGRDLRGVRSAAHLAEPTGSGALLAGPRAPAGRPCPAAPGGWLRAPLRLETTHRAALAPTRDDDALARAGRFFTELEEAWRCSVGSVLEIAWPVYGPEHGGPLLDAVAGTPLPELPLR